MLLGIISDIHTDFKNLKKAITYLEKRNCDEIACLGDIVGYRQEFQDYFKHGQGKECLALVFSECDLIVMGNHDLFALKKVPLYSAGFDYPDDWYSLSMLERKRRAGTKIRLYEDEIDDLVITKELKEQLANVPEFKTRFLSEKLVLFSHYLYPDLSGSTRRREKDYDGFRGHISFMQKYECSLAFIGHDHHEGIEIIKDQQYRKLPYGEYSIGYGDAIIGIPSLVKSKYRSGFVIYHPETGQLEAIPVD